MMQRLDYVLSRNLSSPFGKQDAFFETFVVPPEYFDTIPETNEIERIRYTFVLCKSGVEVFDKYEKEEPAPKEFKVFYEEDSPDKSNFFGTACRVKMSKEARDFFIRISGKNQVTNFRGIVSDYPNLKGFNEFVKNLAKDRNLNYTLLKGAIYLEIAEQSEINQIYKRIFFANNQLGDWLKGGIEAIEKWKFTDENYDYEKHFLNIRNSNPVNPNGYQSHTYKPILPIPAFMTYSDSITGNNRQNIVDKGLSKLSGFVESFEEISSAVVYNIVRITPDITDDIFFAIVFYVKNMIENFIPESIKNVYNKLKRIFKQVLASVKQIANLIKEKVGIELAKMNAFLCGVINGLISLGQTIILLLAMVVENVPFLEDEKTSLLELAKHQEKLEFIEDFVDLFAENSTRILEGITSLFSDNKIWKGVSEFLSGLKKKFLSLNEYFWAYFLGAVVFELILDAVIAYFTGGASLVGKASEKMAQMATKISRVTKQAEQLGAKGLNLSKNLGKKVATTADDLLKWLRKEFEELLEALKSGKFAEWIREKLRLLFDNKEIDDILNADYLSKWDDLPVRRKGYLGGNVLKRRQVQDWIRKIKSISNGESMLVILPKGHKLLQGNRAGFNLFNGNIYVQKGMTEYEIFHESKHLEEFMKLGKDEYIRGMSDLGFSPKEHLIRMYKREKYVFDEIMKNKNKFNVTELKDAERNINDIINRCEKAEIKIDDIK